MKRFIVCILILMLIPCFTVSALAEGEIVIGNVVEEDADLTSPGYGEDYYEYGYEYDSGSAETDIVTILRIFRVPCAIAGIIVGVMAGSMKTARIKYEADDYVTNAGLNLTVKEDFYTGTTTERIYSPVNKNNNGSPGMHPPGR